MMGVTRALKLRDELETVYVPLDITSSATANMRSPGTFLRV